MQLDSLIWATASPMTHKPKIVNKSLLHVHICVLLFQPIENNEVPEYVSEIPAFMALLQPPGGKSYLTLKVPITIAADDNFFSIFPNFQKK